MSSESVQTLKVSDFAKVKGGKRMPAGTALSQRKSQHPYLRIVDFKDGGIDKSNLQYVPDEVFPQIARYVISDRDLYISIVGTIGLVGAVPKELNGANLTENAAKICEIDESKVPVLPIFKALEKYGEIKHEEMFEIFNMGIGLMFAVKPENVERVKELLDEPVYEIGRIVKKDGASVVIK